MKKNLKKYLIILLAAIMIFSLPLSASAATKKNVTKTYKKSVTRMLRGFDSYFGYCCGKNQYFKFDNYARSTMVRMRNYGLSSDKASYVKKKLRPQLKLYFNTSTVKFKKFTKYGIPRNPSYLFCNKNGRIIYTGTALVDTGSRMDDMIYEEFKGTGNAEIHLSRDLAESRVFPAIDIRRSSTRKEELLHDESTLKVLWKLRQTMKGDMLVYTNEMLKEMKKTETNDQFIDRLDVFLSKGKNKGKS